MTNTKSKISILFLLLVFKMHSQTGLDVESGVDRWEIKTTAENYESNSKSKHVSLKKLLTLPLLAKEYSTDEYSNVLIPKMVGTLKEGDIIYTEGYLHLVALERASDTKKDGDYHIQLTQNPEWSDSCFIVEIPYSEFVSNKELKELCDKNRKFIRERLLKDENKEPGSSGNIMKSTVYVKVTGQLFYDAIHASQMRNSDPKKRKYRGKKGKEKTEMHSYTAWEIHPVTKMEFWPNP